MALVLLGDFQLLFALLNMAKGRKWTYGIQSAGFALIATALILRDMGSSDDMAVQLIRDPMWLGAIIASIACIIKSFGVELGFDYYHLAMSLLLMLKLATHTTKSGLHKVT